MHPNTPFCNTCNVPAKLGEAIDVALYKDPMEGVSDRWTVSPASFVGSAPISECLKCPKCGHSWQPTKEEMQKAKVALQHNKFNNSY